MDTEVLRTFLEVNRTRHFGKAAENLFVTQSTVSARIRLLEEAVGGEVFTRSRNDIQLTDIGQRLIHYSESILMTWNRARQETAVHDESGIFLTVAGMTSLWDIILQDWLNETGRKYKDITLRTEVLGFEAIQRRLSEGTLDLAFVFDTPMSWEHNVVEVARLPFIMVSSRENLSVDEAIAGNYIMVDWGTSFSVAHAKHFPELGAPVFYAGLGRIAHNYLLSCGGTAYLAEGMVRQSVSEKKLFPVANAPVIERIAYAVYPEDKDKQQAIKNLLSYFEK